MLLCALVLSFAATGVRAETTLYVGKHFEVRDHDQPTKYVFNGSTRVARITGSLSTNTRIQRFRLHPGWNLLSLAVSATNLSDQFQSPGVVASAHSWNAQTGGYFPVPQVASSGMVLWVNATTNTTLSVLGAYSEPVNREVPAGANYLSGPGLEAWTPNFPGTVSVWHFSSQPADRAPAAFGPWRSRLTGDLSAVNDLPEAFPPGQALYVINQAPFELEVPDPALRVRYYHQDHLGSSSVMTDSAGVLVEETAYYPFGIPRHEHRVRSVEESYKFTQKERDRESGLHYLEARYLAGRVSRFLSADPKYLNLDTLSPSDFNAPQAFNLYAYVRNNPLKYVDPRGLDRRDIGFDAKDIREVWTSNASDEADRVDWGRVGNVVGGVGEAAGGVTLCATLVGCIVGGPLVAHGSDKISTGIVGADETLTAKYLGKDFEEGMDLVSFAAGGATLARGISSKLAERASEASERLMLNIPRGSGTLPGVQPYVQHTAYGDGPALLLRDFTRQTKDEWINQSMQAASGTRNAVQIGGGNPFKEVCEPIFKQADDIFGPTILE